MKIRSFFLIALCTPLSWGIADSAPVESSGGGNSTPYVATQVSTQTTYISAAEIKRFSKGRKVFLRSHVATIYDERDQEFIFRRNDKSVMSIASLSKLMMAMVLLDAKLPMDETITIIKADKDRIRYSKSRLNFGSRITRRDLLLIALMASENRAAAALARTYPGGKRKFVAAMNKKAASLGLRKTHFYDPAGLHDKNVSTARELNELAQVAMEYAMIREFTTKKKHTLTDFRRGKLLKFGNTNRFVKKKSWHIRLSKTGFTNTAGNCLIMKTVINGRPVTMVLLNSWGKLSKYGDSNRLKKWLLKTERRIRKKRLAGQKHQNIGHHSSSVATVSSLSP
ncbi:MAG: serine hydrolase [Thiohalomonadales bacterium]